MKGNFWQVGETIPGSELACEHWNWLSSLLEKVYIDAFIHGYKHGSEDREIDEKKNIK